MEEESTRKRAQEKDTVEQNKKPRSSSSDLNQGDDGDGDDDDEMTFLSIDDDTAEELAKLLEAAPFKVKFMDNPYSSQLIFQSSSSYVTINGNEESCGSSFSDFESSVMASVDMSGLSGGGPWGQEARGFEEVLGLDDCEFDGVNVDDDGVVARFFGDDFFENT